MKDFLRYSKNRILYNIFRFLIIALLAFSVSKCNVYALENASWSNVQPSQICKYYRPLNSTTSTWQCGAIYSTSAWGFSGYTGDSSVVINSSTNPITEAIAFRYNNFQSLKGSNWNLVGQIFTHTAVGADYFGNHVVTVTYEADYGTGSCIVTPGSANSTGKNYITFSCTGQSTTKLNIIMHLDTYISGETHSFMIRSDWSSLTTNLDNSSVINSINQSNQQTINKLDEIKNQNTESENTRKSILQRIIDLPGNIINGLIDGLKSLFIPSNDFFESFINDFLETVKEKLGFLVYPFELIGDVINRFLTIPEASGIIHIPQINEPFSNTKLISDQDFNLKEIFNTGKIGELYNIYLIFVDGLVIVGLVNLARKKYNETIGSGK